MAYPELCYKIAILCVADAINRKSSMVIVNAVNIDVLFKVSIFVLFLTLALTQVQ